MFGRVIYISHFFKAVKNIHLPSNCASTVTYIMSRVMYTLVYKALYVGGSYQFI